MTWDVTTPAGTDALSLGDDKIRELKTDLQTALLANNATLGNEGVFPVSTTNPQYRYRGLKGTTAQRPASGNYGLYFNTDTGTLQRDNGSTWDDISFKPRTGLFFGGTVGGSNVYLTEQSAVTVEAGYLMHRAGSIIGYSIGGTTVTFTSNDVIIFRIRKNGSDVIVASTLTWTANNQNQDTTGTATTGVNTFNAGDRIEVFANYQSGSASVRARAFIEVDLNT